MGAPSTIDETFASSYSLQGPELEFFKAQTGIQDEEELKKHVVHVQQEAWKAIIPCRMFLSFEAHLDACMASMSDLKLDADFLVLFRFKISRLPAYKQLLKLGKEREGAIFLDVGCCFGNEIRKAVSDGFPGENTIGTDLHGDFFELGNKLFKSDFPGHFIPGDALDSNFLKTVPPFYSAPETPRPDLRSLKTLTPLLGHVSAINASSFFHLFDEPQQLEVGRALAGLLSPEPGSLIFGEHAGRPVKGYRTDGLPRDDGSYEFCHSPETWKEMWDGGVFEKGTVKADALLVEVKRPDRVTDDNRDAARFWVMAWSVVRL
ncbi:predicted protein [Postia placenta Mad-698-R]|uniref:Methyltransferase domain-containing protein n=1 Tax=Postia placenta MAD-698-R-SB12 TaxID=670580 RepID=A0A1X6NGG7_9APHY|nr:hypothetical protein POSPLADRAFT_1129687 [Postia placenta MAD-698-R-SB12]EED81244.1 predicted protein [Postia placenta Mad-698-R]OSX67719.1 hypothetical protein POSPLADRAFT_1129687 [Postia placenta MAD-698-R-SB12]